MLRIRPALGADYPLFARLFPELGVDDPIPSRERFEADLSGMIVAEDTDKVIGYAYFQILRETAYVRNIVTAPEERRRGTGRSLMLAIADAGRSAGCNEWCLNVKPGNAPAVRLYESLGLRVHHRSHAMLMEWSALVGVAQARTRPILAEHDAALEERAELDVGMLALLRAKSGRVLLGSVDDSDGWSGIAVFDPAFPGVHPFCPFDVDVALPLLAALRPSARPADSFLNVVVEARPEIVRVLLDRGATVRMEIDHMRGALQASSRAS